MDRERATESEEDHEQRPTPPPWYLTVSAIPSDSDVAERSKYKENEQKEIESGHSERGDIWCSVPLLVNLKPNIGQKRVHFLGELDGNDHEQNDQNINGIAGATRWRADYRENERER